MSQPFQPISINDGDVVDKNLLDALANNDQWLFENMPRMFFNSNSVKRSSGIKIACGYAVVMPTSGKYSSAEVNFGSFFSAGCRPVVVASANSPRQGRLHVWTGGLSDYYPDHRGFRVTVSPDEFSSTINYVRSSCAVSWIAIGY